MRVRKTDNRRRYGWLAISGLALTASILPPTAQADDAPPACDVRLAQATLQAMNFDAGAVDGRWGQTTKAAMQAYQTANDLPASELLDAATCSAFAADRDAGAEVKPFLEAARRSYVVRRDWCGREEYRVACTPGDMLMLSGNLIPCGSTLKHFKEEVGGGAIFANTHRGTEASCKSLNDFCEYAKVAFGGAFSTTCDKRESLSQASCKETLWSVCDQ